MGTSPQDFIRSNPAAISSGKTLPEGARIAILSFGFKNSGFKGLISAKL